MFTTYSQTKLPFLPKVISEHEFKGMQLTKDQTSKLKAWFDAHPNEVICRVTKIVPYPVVRVKKSQTEDDYYVLYPTPLGSGRFGKVFAAYDVTNQCLVAIKSHYIKMQSEGILKNNKQLKNLSPNKAKASNIYIEQMKAKIERVKNETKLIASLSHSNTDKTSSKYDYRGNLNIHEYEVDEMYSVMPLQEGQNLLTLAHGNQHLSPSCWLQILLNICESLQTVHDIAIHRDISLSNILLDLMTGKATITDFGCAYECGRDTILQTTELCGKEHRYAPEFSNTTVYSYSRESDIYALGITFAQFLGFLPVKIIEGLETDALLNVNATAAKKRIPNTEVREAIFELLNDMLKKESDERIDLNKAIITIKKIRAHCLDVTSFFKKIALVDLEEFKHEDKKALIITALKNGQFDEIQLIDANKQYSDNYLNFREHFERNDLPIGSTIHHGESKEIFARLKMATLRKSPVEQHFLISSNEQQCAHAGFYKIYPIKIDSNQPEVTRTLDNYLNNQQLTKQQSNNIVKRLTAEATRLNNRYINRCWLFKRPNAQTRIDIINNAIGKFKPNNNMSYFELNNLLNNLATQMFNIGFNPRSKSQGARNIEKINNDVRSNFSGHKNRSS